MVGYVPVLGGNRLLVPRLTLDTLTNLADDVPYSFTTYPRQLPFRNYLLAFPDIADAYAAEKMRARDLFPYNSTDYAAEKGAFIRATEAKALAWFVG